MSKVLVDRELLEQIVNTNMGDYALIALQHKELLDNLAQPAEAEGVECPVVACISSETGELYHEDYGLKDPVYLVLQSDHLAALSALLAERDALKGALERIVAAEWSSSETATDFAISQTKGFLIWEMKKIARAALQEP